MNLLHLFKKKKTLLSSGSLPLLNPGQILLCASSHLGSQMVLVLELCRV